MTDALGRQVWLHGVMCLLMVWLTQSTMSCKTENKAQFNNEGQKGTVNFKSETYDELLLFSRRLIAVVQCNDVDFVERGTRSERVVVKATTIAVGEGQEKESYQLTRYSQGDPLLTVGQTYLVAAYDDGAWGPAWSLVEWLVIPHEEAQSAAKAAGELLRRRAAETER